MASEQYRELVAALLLDLRQQHGEDAPGMIADLLHAVVQKGVELGVGLTLRYGDKAAEMAEKTGREADLRHKELLIPPIHDGIKKALEDHKMIYGGAGVQGTERSPKP